MTSQTGNIPIRNMDETWKSIVQTRCGLYTWVERIPSAVSLRDKLNFGFLWLPLPKFSLAILQRTPHTHCISRNFRQYQVSISHLMLKEKLWSQPTHSHCPCKTDAGTHRFTQSSRTHSPGWSVLSRGRNETSKIRCSDRTVAICLLNSVLSEGHYYKQALRYKGYLISKPHPGIR